ncbi:MAG: hypothetical protein KC910_21455 [Candidatus Eremiobacteraeota bacterium]|nr:hypothetical protein [Candidatus Eremiobacteraeota bacterium]
MHSAVEVLHQVKPVDVLDQTIYRTLQRIRGDAPEPFLLRELNCTHREISGRYLIRADEPARTGGEAAALGALAVTGLLFARALVTRKPLHWAGALWAGSIALMTGQDLIKRASSAVRRFTGNNQDFATMTVLPEELIFLYRDQEIHVNLPPAVSVVLRTFRHRLRGREEQFHLLQLDLHDGRVITLSGYDDVVTARRNGHQVCRSMGLGMVFQNIEVTEVENGISWELGPQLVEPALN